MAQINTKPKALTKNIQNKHITLFLSTVKTQTCSDKLLSVVQWKIYASNSIIVEDHFVSLCQPKLTAINWIIKWQRAYANIIWQTEACLKI